MIEEYRDWIETQKFSKKTVQIYLKSIQKFINWIQEVMGKSFDVKNVNEEMMNDFIISLKVKEKLQETTINKIVSGLNNFFSYVLKNEYISLNPMRNITLKRAASQYSVPEFITEEEIQKYFDAIELENSFFYRSRDTAISHLLLKAGLRVNEIVDINMSDVSTRKKCPCVIVNNTNGKVRSIPLEDETIKSIKKWILTRKNLTSQESLFITEKGERISQRLVQYIVSKYCSKAGLKGITPQMLRHSYGKHIALETKDVKKLAYLLGIESIESAKRYFID